MRSVVQMFAAQGAEPARLFREAGLELERLSLPHSRFSVDEVSRLWKAAAAITGKPHLGLDREVARGCLNFKFGERAMSTGPHLMGGLRALSRYLALIGDATAFSLEPERGDCWLELAKWPELGMPRERIEFGMMAFFLLGEHATRRRLRLVAAEFGFPAPADFHAHRMAFQCPMRFDQPVSRIRFSRDDLALPVASPAKTLAALQERVIEKRLERLGGARTSYRASEEIIHRLHGGLPTAGAVARGLGMSEAVLQQRLRAEKYSFDALLDDVRRELAAVYFAQPHYAPLRIAHLLGWQSTADLGAACKRWWGAQPAQYHQDAMAGGRTRDNGA